MFVMDIISKLKELTHHDHVVLTARGNTAIDAAVNAISGKILIPEEGGWLSYQKIDGVEYVSCDDAKLNLDDLKSKLSTNTYGALLYQNPGGYFAQQPMKEIYELCQQHDCVVILDVSGSIGTPLCDGKYADIIVGSFGKWKVVEARVGGFISCKESELFEKIHMEELEDKKSLLKINEELQKLPKRITFLQQRVQKIKEDLKEFNIVHPTDLSFVVVIKYSTDKEKESLINYCGNNSLEWTECPRYIRLNQRAISIEVKRLQND